MSRSTISKTDSAPVGGAREKYARNVLVVLFLANLLNFFDRTMPAVLIEEVRADIALTDTQIGLVGAAFTVVYALAGLPLGRLADRRSRTRVMSAGLTAWSVMTAATGAVSSFAALVAARIGVGIGEASCAPAANSVIADIYPTHRRSRAVAVFMLGLPLGNILAFFTVGAMAEAFDSWRAPFFIAAVPGLILAVVMLRLREPERGASDPMRLEAATSTVRQPVRRILRSWTFRWLVLAFVGYNVAAGIVGTFTVVLFQRYFDLSLTSAASITGGVVGVTGLIGLVVGGRIADRASRRSSRHRVLLGAGFLAASVPLTGLAFLAGDSSVAAFALLFALGWLLAFIFFPCAYPAVSDVVEPRLRATAIALLFALGYLLGAAGGPLLVGMLSDSIAAREMAELGVPVLTDAIRGLGIHDAMFIVTPASLALAAFAMLLASRSINRERERMLRGAS